MASAADEHQTEGPLGVGGLEESPATLVDWLLAALPIALLIVLVARGRTQTTVVALLAVGAALVVGLTSFQAGPRVLAVAVGKGLWTGLWILWVIWPALLLFHVVRRAGLMDMGELFSGLLRHRAENVLIMAWVFPSFVQGIAGFGTPIAVAAPLLVSMGVNPVQALVLPLVGYHWSVTFGSMGSSFYMGGLTADLTGGMLASYGEIAALMLGVNCLLAGILVCLVHGGMPALRQAAPMILVVGSSMALTLNLVVRVEPAMGSVAAGAAGLIAIVLYRLSQSRGALSSPGSGSIRDAGQVLIPYGYLLALVLAVFVPPASRSFVRSHLLLAPSFPGTRTGRGFVSPAVEAFTPIGLLSHPGSYVLLASVIGYATYVAVRRWPPGQLRPTLRDWVTQAVRASWPVLALATLATVMVDSGMVRVLAAGLASVAGRGFLIMSPIVGALGAFMTGSTTNSNALFSALQRDVAQLIEVDPALLVAAQSVGGNVGNALAPVIIVLGAAVLGGQDNMVGLVFRRVLGPAAVLTVAVVMMTLSIVALA